MRAANLGSFTGVFLVGCGFLGADLVYVVVIISDVIYAAASCSGFSIT